jgi:TatD DNase family protein
MYRLIDTHAHLEEMENLEEVLDKSREAGVVAIIAVGSDLETNKRTLEIAERYPDFVYPALGWHPWFIRSPAIDVNLEFIRENIDKAIAVGEIGLDYHKRVRAGADKSLQKTVLGELLKIAGDSGKPALIHSRYAWRDALEAVLAAKLKKAVFHWYTGTSGVLRDIIDNGFYISVTPAVEYHEEHRRAVKEVPLEKMLLETDAPVTYARGRDTEFEANPADVNRSLKGAASLKGISEEEIAGATTENAKMLFGISRR